MQKARLFIAIPLFFLPHMAFAQSANVNAPQINPARVDQRLKEEAIRPQVEEKILVEEVYAQEAPDGADQLAFTLKSINLRGVTLYSESQLQAVYADYIGQDITLATIYTIAAKLTAQYRNDGYILSQVIVPPQEIDGGNVVLQAIEGRLNNISLELESGGQSNLIERYLSRLSTSEPLNVADLERVLLLINDLPGASARSILSPSEDITDATDLDIIVTQDHFDGYATLDNHGSRFLGTQQMGAGFSGNNLLGLHERVSAQIVTAQDNITDRELEYLALRYLQPIFGHGTTLELSATHASTQPGFNIELFEVKGKSQSLGLKVAHPFIRSRDTNMNGHVGFDYQNSLSTNNLLDRREDRLRVMRMGVDYQHADDFWGGGVNAFDLEYSKGFDVLAASHPGRSDLSRPEGDPRFSKLNLEIQRQQAIYQRVSALVAAKGQWASNALLSAEEFGLGGQQYGRGFDSSEVVGDHGLAGKVELRWQDPYIVDWLDTYQVYGFFDAGRVWNRDQNITLAEKKESLTSAGFGLRISITEDLQAGAYLAYPISRDIATKPDEHNRFFFNLGYQF